MPRRRRRARAALLAMLLLAAGSAVPQQALPLAGRVVGPDGAPRVAAAVLAHGTGDAALTDAQGRFSLMVQGGDDVVTAALPGHLDGHAWTGGAIGPEEGPDGLRVVLAPAPPTRDPVVFRDLLELAPRPPGAVATGERPILVLPFPVESGALGGHLRVNATAPLRVRVDLAHEASGTRYGLIVGEAPLDLALPSGWLEGFPGGYVAELRPQEDPEASLEVVLEVEVRYGPLPRRSVQGLPPVVPDEVGDTQTVRVVQPSQDIAWVMVTNETDTDLEVALGLAELASTAPSGGAYAMWVVAWNFSAVRYYVSHSSGVSPDAFPAPAGFFHAGTCAGDGICTRQAIIPGRLEPGRPGVIRFIVPKAVVGAPPPGTNLTDLAAYTFHTTLDTLFLESEMSRGSDVTGVPGAYLVGADALAMPAGTRERLLRETEVRPAPVDGPGELWPGVLPSLVAVAALGVVAAAVHRRRTAPAPAAAPPPEKYEVLRLLGEGANGRTFLGRHRGLGKQVAIKELLPHILDDPEAQAMFEREARIGGALHHPNVVDIYDIEATPKGLRLVMEYCDGGSLEDRLRNEALPLEEALRLWAEVLAGLAAIHAAGVVHRDIKPSNILLTAEGHAKVADFGVARSTRERTIAGTGSQSSPVGTPLYMSPEQLQGKRPTAASDVYAATAVAYRMLTGRPHITVDTPTPWAVLAARAQQRPEVPVPGLPAEVNSLLARGLADDPGERPAGAQEMLDEVRRMRGGAARGPRGGSRPRPSGEPGAPTLR